MSSISGMNSWGLYIFAAGALVLLFTPQLGGVARDARVGADWRIVDGVRAVIDSLHPGVTVLFVYGPTLTLDGLHLGGHLVSCADGNGTITAPVKWALPNANLSPSITYRLTLVVDAVTVTKSV